jgi:hypothetical protein
VERTFEATTVASPETLYAVLADLGTYPQWLALAHQVEPADDESTADEPAADGSPADGLDGDGPDGQAWMVTLRARVGPLARSKRLRMVRTVADGATVRFERRELDERDHAQWTLEAVVAPVDDPAVPEHRSRAHLVLSYSGSLWSSLLDGVLDSSAEAAARDLQAYAAERAVA